MSLRKLQDMARRLLEAGLNRHGAPPRFRNMGVRIEDDVLITDGALELLSKALPRTLLQIENLNESLAQLNNVDRKLELRAEVEAKDAWNRLWHPRWLRILQNSPDSICAPRCAVWRC